MRLSRQREVAGEAAAAGEERVVLDAAHRLAAAEAGVAGFAGRVDHAGLAGEKVRVMLA